LRTLSLQFTTLPEYYNSWMALTSWQAHSNRARTTRLRYVAWKWHVWIAELENASSNATSYDRSGRLWQAFVLFCSLRGFLYFISVLFSYKSAAAGL